MELKDIIREYKNRNRLSNKEIAERFHVTHITVGRWLRGEVKTIQEETAQNMSHVLGYDVQAILQGRVVTLKRPILGSAKAGYGLYLQEDYLGEETVTIDEYQQGDYFLKVTGDSMIQAGITDGSLVYIKQCSDINNGDIAVFSIGEEVTIKQYYREKDAVKLAAANPDYPDMEYTLQQVKELPVNIIGKVLYSKHYF